MDDPLLWHHTSAIPYAQIRSYDAFETSLTADPGAAQGNLRVRTVRGVSGWKPVYILPPGTRGPQPEGELLSGAIPGTTVFVEVNGENFGGLGEPLPQLIFVDRGLSLQFVHRPTDIAKWPNKFVARLTIQPDVEPRDYPIFVKAGNLVSHFTRLYVSRLPAERDHYTPVLLRANHGGINAGTEADEVLYGRNLYTSTKVEFSVPGVTISGITANEERTQLSFHIQVDPSTPRTGDEATHFTVRNGTDGVSNPIAYEIR
jgi:hypothetical protein